MTALGIEQAGMVLSLLAGRILRDGVGLDKVSLSIDLLDQAVLGVTERIAMSDETRGVSWRGIHAVIVSDHTVTELVSSSIH